MKGIQILLIFGALASLLLYLRYFRSLIRDRLIVSGCVLLVILGILFPDATTVIANKMGVGRGADLLLYFTAFGSAFLFILLYLRVQKLERNQTEIVRQIAIQNPCKNVLSCDRPIK